jgi:hypothetical protein
VGDGGTRIVGRAGEAAGGVPPGRGVGLAGGGKAVGVGVRGGGVGVKGSAVGDGSAVGLGLARGLGLGATVLVRVASTVALTSGVGVWGRGVGVAGGGVGVVMTPAAPGAVRSRARPSP